MKMTRKTRSARIARIRENLRENDRRLAEGVIDRPQWIRCNADGRRAIAELRAICVAN